MAPSTVSEKLRSQLAALPARPGVYLMRDSKGDVIYVGKAAKLRSRVRSYFGSPRSMEPKTRVLREHIDDFEYIVCKNAGEALLLEAALIKRHQPFFNIRLKDDKRYPYLKVDRQNPWPRVFITRRIENDGARYFGPYASAGSVRATLDLVKKLFPWRSCTKEITGTDARPCLDYFIKRCIAPCTSFCTPAEYAEVIDNVILFLEGKSSDVIRRVRTQMGAAAESLDFERAAILRDQLLALERTAEHQTVANVRDEDLDVFGLAHDGDRGCVQVFFVRGTQMIGRDSFPLDGVKDEPESSILESFLLQFYESAQYIPRLIAVPGDPGDRQTLQELLSEKRGANVEIRTPMRGEKRRLVEMARENAAETLALLKVKWQADSTRLQNGLEQLQEELALPSLPHRIECYDNSNIQGASPVSSMVVFVDGRPATDQYRKFKIRSVEGADDFATMAEVIGRRFRHAANREDGARPEGTGGSDRSAAWDLPDLVVIDGGKGQLGAAAQAMQELGVHHIPVVSLAKRFEEVFVPDEGNPVVLPRGSEALYLMQRIRDEAHRFAITYHRQVRGRAQTTSALDSVPGIGPRRKRALLRRFGSVKAIREASVEELSSTIGFTRRLAERVKEHL